MANSDSSSLDLLKQTRHAARVPTASRLPVRAPSAYDAASLVWSKRAWLLAQPDPAAALERRISLAAAAIDAEAREIQAWTLVRLVGLLIDRFSWGGYNEQPFAAVAELLCETVDP